ncbi:MAG: ABC transporter substrate-binding protein [Acidimicrobiales bacterium]
MSTLTFGLFKGAAVGTQAYADYVNSNGGIHGRRIVVHSSNDGYNNGANNKALTQAATQHDLALVGGFSLNDSYGGTVLAQNPGMPDVSVTLSPTANRLPNVFSPAPADGGWELGPLEYFKKRFPSRVKAVGALIANEASAVAQWQGEKAAMNHVGYHVIYDSTFPITQTDFTQNVIAMRNRGVKILFIEQMPVNYASAVLKALNQQNYHPQVVLGASTYSSTLVSSSGGAAATNGDYLEQNAALYLGQDAATIPAVATFLHWVNVASPGFRPDLFTLYGWISAELFADALRKAGSDPSRGSLLQALSKVTSFSGHHIIAPTDPAAKTVGNCYLLAQIQNGQVRRIGDPSPAGSTHGYRCNYSYYSPSS